MTGRVVIITGGNSGIGYEVAKYLCEGGNDVVLACRNREKGNEAVNKIKSVLPNSLVQCMELDLASVNSIHEFVKDFTRKKKKLNVLINNAAMAPNFKDTNRKMNPDGHELTMATNHLGPFLLTNLLLEYMIQTASIMRDGRIINITCSEHDHINNWSTKSLDYLDTDNFQLQKSGTYSGHQAYKNSKLCNVLMTYHLADRLKSTWVSCNVVDPGSVPTTRLMRNANKVKQKFNICCIHNVMGRCTHLTRSLKDAASHVCEAATDDKYEERSGKFYLDGVEDRSSAESYDRDLQREVWNLTAKLVNTNTFADEGFDDISLGSTKLL